LDKERREWSAGDNGEQGKFQLMSGAQWDGEKWEGQWWIEGR
jgi:hypothetical protein